MKPPLRVVLPGDTETPVSAFLKLAAAAPQAFLLESVEPGERVGRFSFIGVNPRRVLRTEVGEGPGPFALLEEALRGAREPRHEGYPPFTGGLVGYIAYDAVKRVEPRVPIANTDETGFPEAVFFDVDTVVAFDNVRRELQLIARQRPEDGDDVRAERAARRRLAALEKALKRPLQPRRVRRLPPVTFHPRVTRRQFIRSVEKAREYVAAGDVQQVVVSQRFDAETSLDGFELYRALRRINPSPFMFFFRDGARELIGASPERLVEVRGRQVSVRPIAGTRKRGADATEDARLEAELLADPKEAAEHVMLVDLGRNDVGRVSELGTVKVESYRVVERYSHVLHLVSQVRGTLAPGVSAIDALKAAFPAGTLSGAPKVRAMEIIDELEQARRGPYGGAVGYVDASGDVDFAITIRSILRHRGHLHVQAGAGVVHDSVPELEYEETLNKARALFAAADLATRGVAP